MTAIQCRMPGIEPGILFAILAYSIVVVLSRIR